MLNELRLALRSLARSPGYTSVVVAILALGIGTCAALHSYLENTLLHRFHFPEMDRLWAVISLTVLISVGLHGVTVTPAMRWLDRRRRRQGVLPLEEIA